MKEINTTADNKGNRLFRQESAISSFFLDSGAHSLYNKIVRSQGKEGYNMADADLKAERYTFYRTKGFKKYLDNYAKWVKENSAFIDFYVTVDAIFHPEYSWRATEYLKKEHGLKPVPVIHYKTPLKWVDKYLEAGDKFIGIGGLGQDATTKEYMKWADDVYRLVCPAVNKHMPIVRTHGFAMTSWTLLGRYPWWSVDSASWLKAAAFGAIYVPTRTGGEFNFIRAPYSIPASAIAKKGLAHWHKDDGKKTLVLEWLKHIGIPLGEVAADGKTVVKWGVVSDWEARAKANLIYFEEMRKHFPEWPWAFTVKRPKGLIY